MLYILDNDCVGNHNHPQKPHKSKQELSLPLIILTTMNQNTLIIFFAEFYLLVPVMEIRTVLRADRGSRIPDLKPCKNTRIRIPDLRIRIPVKIRGSGSRICGSRICNTGS